MRILALDQSTKITGFSVFEDDELIDYGTVCSTTQKDAEPFYRMGLMRKRVLALIEKYKPDLVSIEATQYQSNLGTYAQLSQMQGVIFSLLFERNISFHIIEATSWRKFCGVVGKKRSEQKASAIQIVQERYGISPGEDASEAILQGYWATNMLRKGK